MYIYNNLLADEEIIYWTRPHWIIFIKPILILLFSLIILIYGEYFFQFSSELFSLSLNEIISLLFLIIAVYVGLSAYIRYVTSEYAITNKRILKKTGWISRNVLELFLTKVEAIHINQSVSGRLLNYGTLVVIGTGGTGDVFPITPNPLKFRRLAQLEINKLDKIVLSTRD